MLASSVWANRSRRVSRFFSAPSGADRYPTATASSPGVGDRAKASSVARRTISAGDPSAAVVGYGSGKAKEVPQAIRKGIESAKKNLVRINLNQTTIPHTVLGRFGSGMVLLKPAPEGTGVIAGGAVRAVMTSAGVQNVLTKSIGTTNPHNVIKATFDALKKLKNREAVAAMRGKAVEDL